MNDRIEPAADGHMPPQPGGSPGAVRIGEAIDFSDAAWHRQLCAGGFGPREPDGTWTERAEAVLVLELADEVEGRLALWLTQKPFVTADHAQLFDVAWNGVEVGRVRLALDQAAPHMLKIVQPAECAGAPLARVEFRFLNLSSPAQTGHSDDARPLGLKLERIVLTGADAPAPPGADGRVVVVEAPSQAERLARIEATCAVLVAEVRRTQALVEQLQHSAAQVAETFARMRSDPDRRED